MGTSTSSASDSSTGTDVQSGYAGGRDFTSNDSFSIGNSSTASGDSDTGSSTVTSHQTSSDSLTRSDTYSSGGYDSQTVATTADGTVIDFSDQDAGTYSLSSFGSNSQTTSETGMMAGAYTLGGSQTGSYSNSESGDSDTGDYELAASSSEQSTYTRSGPGYGITQSASSSGTATTSGNHLDGSFDTTAVGTTRSNLEEQITGSGVSSSLSELTTSNSSLTETGNEITGVFSSTDHQQNTMTLNQSGHNAAGTYSLSESSADSPTVITSGNSVDGTSTATTTGDQTYSLAQTNVNGSDSYTLTGHGSNPYSRTDAYNANTGQHSVAETGSDSYSLGQSGSGGGAAYTLSLTGSDSYTTTASSNDQDGSFSQSTTGGGSYSKANGLTVTTGSTSFSDAQVGNTRDGEIHLTRSGTDRYSLLNGFNDTADGSTGSAGMARFSAVGLPVFVGNASVPSGTFSSVGDDRHKYCFAAGTQVLLADGSYRAIEKIEVGTMVLSAPEDDPEATPGPCRVLEVYHNPPARIWHVKVQDEVICTTAGHPFYVKARGWTKVKDLRAGDRLRTHKGKWSAVQSVRNSGHSLPVFNLCVETAHTYFVRVPSGGSALLVHNWSWGQTWGLVKVVGAVAETAAGVSLAVAGVAATAVTGPAGVAAAIGGVAVAAHGLDEVVSGARQVYDGKVHDSGTSQLLQAAGMSKTAANATDAGISVVGSLGAGVVNGAVKAATIAGSAEAAGMSATEALAAWEKGSQALPTKIFNMLGGTSTSPIAKAKQIDAAVNAVKAGTATADQAEIAAAAQNMHLVQGAKLVLTGLTPAGDIGAGVIGSGGATAAAIANAQAPPSGTSIAPTTQPAAKKGHYVTIIAPGMPKVWVADQ